LSYRFVFGTAILAATFLAPTGMTQTTSPDLVPNLSAATRAWKAPDLKPAVRGRNPVRGFIEAKSKSTERFSKKQFFVLSAVVYGVGLADMHQTLEGRKNLWWYETDPLARPFVKLPAPAYYATGLAMATGLNWLSWRMGHSRRWRKLSPVPQLLAIGGNIYGFRTNRY
jgi:hypothetical protein